MTRLAAGAVLVGLLFAAPLRAADLPEIKQRGALRVLAIVDTRAPEFFSLKSQASPGFDVEILLGFAKAQKVELKVVPATGWAALVPALVEGSGDLVAGRFGPTPARRRLILLAARPDPGQTRHARQTSTRPGIC